MLTIDDLGKYFTHKNRAGVFTLISVNIFEMGDAWVQKYGTVEKLNLVQQGDLVPVLEPAKKGLYTRREIVSPNVTVPPGWFALFKNDKVVAYVENEGEATKFIEEISEIKRYDKRPLGGYR